MEAVEERESVATAVVRSEKRPARTTRATPGAFRTVWRWHFYAGVVITPVLLVVAATGALYIFAPEIEQAVRSGLMFVEPRPESSTVPARALVEAATQARPGIAPTALILGGEPDRAAVVALGPPEQTVRVFVDPYSGRVQGSVDDAVDPTTVLIRGTLKLHRQLFLGTTGRVVVELTTGWTVVLLVSGIYLWWPRRRTKTRGVWTVRWAGAKPYVRLRDLHAVAGAYLMPVALVIAVTGHFYTFTWGAGARYALGAAPRKPPVKTGAGKSKAAASAPASIPPALDRIVVESRALYPDRVLRVPLAPPPAGAAKGAEAGTLTVTALNRFESGAYGPIRGANIVCRPDDGTVVSNRSMAEKPDRLVQSWAYPLHVGSIAGLPSKLIWLVACLVLTALPVTGLWMWWERRPAGTLGLPRRPDFGPPLWLGAIVTALSLFYPMVGASALLITAGEILWRVATGRRSAGRPGAELDAV